LKSGELMKRWLLVPALALVAASCQDMNESTMGPEEQASAPSFSHSGLETSCLDLADHPQSPCDGRLNGGRDGFYFLPSLVANPGLSDPLVTGLAPYLMVEAVNIFCPSGDDGCGNDGTMSAVEEGTGSYSASWKTNKKRMEPESAWRLKVWLTADGTTPTALLGYRDVILSDTPSTDQPADEPELVIQIGSNQNVPFYITQEGTCQTSGPDSITCLIGDGGGELGVTTASAAAQLNIGPDNGTNIFTLRIENCDSNLDVDVPLLGCRVDVESPTLAQGAILTGSSIEICEFIDIPYGESDKGYTAYVLKVDESGQTVLPPTAFSCSAALAQAAPSGIRGLLANGLGRVASLFTAQPLVATTMVVGSVSGGGGRLRDLSRFQLAIMPKATKLSGDGAVVAPGGSVTVEVQTSDANGYKTPFTTIHFKPDPETDPTGEVSCPTSVADGSCTPVSARHVKFTTGDSGIASAVWSPAGTGTMKLMALGCGVAVEGSDTPTTAVNGVLGTPAPDGVDGGVASCNRSPEDDPDDGTSGYANGPVTGVVDPFETIDDNEVALNDLPLVFTTSICSVDVDGEKESAWDTCAHGVVADIPVNLPGGGKNSGATATLRWFNDADSLYLSLEVPRTSDESSTSVWFEFNAGPGSESKALAESDLPAAFDDLIGVERKSSVSVPSDRYLDATCAGSSGSSVCNAIDANNNVNADVQGPGVGTNGDFIFYEVSQLLNSGDDDDFDLQSDDYVGLFFRLAVGNGAQGKTIWPGFRDYFVIPIQ
jgi:hypothetical protein